MGKFNNNVFVKFDSRYEDYFQSYSSYFGRALRLLKYMYGITNYGKLFADELIELLLEAVCIQCQFQMSIYYKYAPDRKILLFHIMLMNVSIGILLNLLEFVCG